ncbi:urate oxidase [Streptomyces mobaraensis NBRC 13819 = DSM 40847]|uniref:Uricase n=2 Tax=Streptomyces mobaraensis TaxID=35621 RepID=A0A5N5W879_STRMB|nr:urate oxidase [Streptomyces mobaraensis]KAB7843815.1 urate oxidase [Streptomyces mobaraensis]QTT78080.1 urate oxidase [Streptomyces mobaraensis NBRC 13819 = DSM 40847]
MTEGPTTEASSRPAATRPVLGQNQYGKAECHVVRVTRDGATHHIKDLVVSVALSGDMEDVHLSGSNANVLTTDATKNTVFAFAKERGIASAEEFGIHLARHFVTSQRAIHRARIRIEEHAWDRIDAPGGDARHSFVRAGRETRTAQITYDGTAWEVISGLKDLVVLNSTGSEFRGFVKDHYTTLEETDDRVLATEVNSRWRYGWTDDARPAPDWDGSWAAVRGHLLHAFADTYSYSLQQTLHAMGGRVVEHRPEIEEIRLSLPNKHHFLVDLAPFGLKNDHEVYYAADRPYGLIEATVLRPGAEPGIPVDLTCL